MGTRYGFFKAEVLAETPKAKLYKTENGEFWIPDYACPLWMEIRGPFAVEVNPVFGSKHVEMYCMDTINNFGQLISRKVVSEVVGYLPEKNVCRTGQCQCQGTHA